MTERIAWLDGHTLNACDNAFGVMAQVERALKQLGTDRAVIKTFMDDLLASQSNDDLLDLITAKTGIKFTGRDTGDYEESGSDDDMTQEEKDDAEWDRHWAETDAQLDRSKP